jgi:hypothetical protein
MKMQLSCGCCETTSIFAGVVRPLNGGGPLNADVSVAGYVDEWDVCPESANGQAGDYWLPMKASNVTSFEPGDPIFNVSYELKSKPFRYVLAGRGDDPGLGIVCDYSLGYENRATGPDAGNHLSPLIATSVGIRPPIVGFGWSAIWTSPFGGGTGSTKTIDITHARVWINGADASGVVAMPGGWNAAVPLLDPHDMTNATVAVDVWYKVTVFIPASQAHAAFPETYPLEPGTNTPIMAKGSCVTCNNRNQIYPTLYNTSPSSPWYRALANPYLARASYGARSVSRWTDLSSYTLLFDRQGPGGVESLALREQTGWTLTTSGGTTTLSHDATNDFVTVQIAREVPRIQVFKFGFDITGASRRCNYSPRGTARYDSFLTALGFGNYATAPRGDWQKNGTTIFGNDGRVVGSGAFTSPQTWYPPESGIPAGVDFYSEYPLQITMVKS